MSEVYNEYNNCRNNIYIPIGFDCAVSAKLKTINLRNASYPFDWNIIKYDGIYDLINDNFLDLFNKEFLVYGNKSYFHKYDNDETMYKHLIPVFNIKYNILFVHDFIENMDANMIFEKYNRRIKRLINNFSNNNIVLVYENASNEYMNNIYQYWEEYFDNKNIFSNLKIKNYKNINDIKNLIQERYMNKNISLCNINELN